MDTGLPITRVHLAALRAWLQGVPVEVIAGRFLAVDDDVPDARLAHRLILQIRDALIVRAQQHGRADLASRIASPPRGSDKGMSRASAALADLESLGTPRANPSHAIELWFAPALARRLRAAGLATVGQLHRRQRERGAGWWRQLPRVGRTAAATLEAWLSRYAILQGDGPLTLDVGAAGAAIVLLTPDAPTIPPLERMRLPAQLDGHAGANRAPHEFCAIGATHDLEAIGSWLDLWRSSPETFRAYRREAERFLAWCITARFKALSSIDTDDCRMYRDWLLEPTPAARWMGPALPRDRAGWRPFVRPLSRDSRVYAETVLSALYAWLVGRGYLRGNPWTGLPRQKKTKRQLQIQKAVPTEQWLSFVAWLATRSAHDAQLRAAYAAVRLLRDSGMRCAEAARAQRAQLQALADVPGLWGELDIVGKGEIPRAVPIGADTYRVLRAHWQDRGIEDAAGGPLLAPLVRPRTPRAQTKTAADGYSVRGLRGLIARAYDAWLEELKETHPAAAAAAIKIRPHALRHTFGTHGIASGIDADVIQAYLGHADLATTAIYTRASERRRQGQIGRLFGASEG